MVRFELQMLAELGFGLDLESCAATGARRTIWSMCRRSRAARCRAPPAEPWQDRLLRLPAFLSDAVTPSLDDIADGFALTGFFLARHVLEPRGLLPCGCPRARFVAARAQAAGGAASADVRMQHEAARRRRIAGAFDATRINHNLPDRRPARQAQTAAICDAKPAVRSETLDCAATSGDQRAVTASRP